MDAAELLKVLPSTFYRVAAKALIFDEAGRLLVTKNEDNEWEIPGGGWEYEESAEECLRRELQEETMLTLASLGELRFVFPAVSDRGWHVLRVVYVATVEPGTPKPADDMIDAAYVTKEQLLALPFTPGDAPIKDYAGQIWPPAVEKIAGNL
jgi:8-oxo-dGTP diphosphatase